MRVSRSVLSQVSVLVALLAGCGSPTTVTPTGGAVMAISDGEPGCRLTDGSTAALGAVAPSDDGTNTCTCGATYWACTELAFHAPPSIVPPSAPPSAPPPSAPPPSAPSTLRQAHWDTTGACSVTDGTVAAVGTSLPSDDGCNDCTCRAGGWACTEMACVN